MKIRISIFVALEQVSSIHTRVDGDLSSIFYRLFHRAEAEPSEESLNAQTNGKEFRIDLVTKRESNEAALVLISCYNRLTEDLSSIRSMLNGFRFGNRAK